MTTTLQKRDETVAQHFLGMVARNEKKNWHGERKARKHTVFNPKRIGHNFYFMYGRYTMKYSRLVVSTYLWKKSKYIFSLQWKNFRLFLPSIELGTLFVLSTRDNYYTTETWLHLWKKFSTFFKYIIVSESIQATFRNVSNSKNARNFIAPSYVENHWLEKHPSLSQNIQ